MNGRHRLITNSVCDVKLYFDHVYRLSKKHSTIVAQSKCNFNVGRCQGMNVLNYLRDVCCNKKTIIYYYLELFRIESFSSIGTKVFEDLRLHEFINKKPQINYLEN